MSAKLHNNARGIAPAAGVLLLVVMVIFGFTVLNISSSDDGQVDELSSIRTLEDSYTYNLTAEDCTSYEQFDEATGECYFECDSDEECDFIEEQIEAELDGFAELLADDASSVHGETPASEDDLDARYTINSDGNTLEPVPSNARHAELWELFTAIAPASFISENVAEFASFTDTESGTEAYVEPLADDPTLWRLAVNEATFYETGELQPKPAALTMVHEFAHILTLQAAQVPPADIDPNASFERQSAASADAADNCQTFFTGEGCATSNSYISAFFDQFWADIYSELPDQEASEDDRYAFYERYQNRFVSDYAATNPGEDIAESFAHFVIETKASGNSIADQKHNFFYDYGELVSLRQSIRGRLLNL